jgi:PAS domain S-box-containing protein
MFYCKFVGDFAHKAHGRFPTDLIVEARQIVDAAVCAVRSEGSVEPERTPNYELPAPKNQLQASGNPVGLADSPFAIVENAIATLAPNGQIASWSVGAERITGYAPSEVIGRHFSMFQENSGGTGSQQNETLEQARCCGSVQGQGWRLRKDGSRFWANVSITAVCDDRGKLAGFAILTRVIAAGSDTEQRLQWQNSALEIRVEQGNVALTNAVKELEAFTYAVAHDLRAPLRSMNSFSQALMEDFGDRLDGQALDYLTRICRASQRMSALIDDLLKLAGVTRGDFQNQPVDLSAIVNDIVAELRRATPDREVRTVVANGVHAQGDRRLIAIALQNLLENSWKFTRRVPAPRIEFGVRECDGKPIYFVRDNGAGFDMAYAHKLFAPFQRLHTTEEFEGTGIGLVTVKRIVRRHSGDVWLKSELGLGTEVSFMLSGQEGSC